MLFAETIFLPARFDVKSSSVTSSSPELSGERSQVCDAERYAGGEDRLAGVKIFTAFSNVASCVAHVADRNRIAPIVRIFMPNDCVRALRYWSARHDAYRFTGFNSSVWKRPGRDFSHHLQRCARSCQIARANSVAVHGRIVPWR